MTGSSAQLRVQVRPQLVSACASRSLIDACAVHPACAALRTATLRLLAEISEPAPVEEKKMTAAEVHTCMGRGTYASVTRAHAWAVHTCMGRGTCIGHACTCMGRAHVHGPCTMRTRDAHVARACACACSRPMHGQWHGCAWPVAWMCMASGMDVHGQWHGCAWPMAWMCMASGRQQERLRTACCVLRVNACV